MAGLLPALLRSGLASCRAAPCGTLGAHRRAFGSSVPACQAEPEPAFEPECEGPRPARWLSELGTIRSDWTCVLAVSSPMQSATAKTYTRPSAMYSLSFHQRSAPPTLTAQHCARHYM